MNILKKVYCRTYQIAFRVALPILPYRNPEIIDSISDIPDIIQKNGFSHPIIVTDSVISSFDFYRELKDSLKNKGLSVSVYDGTLQNPTTAMVEEAVKIYKKDGCDCIIAFGGGSPMDCAKALGARIAKPNKPLSKMAGILKVMKKIPMLIAIPTTAGTGSEATLAAVITDAQTRHKYAINDFPLIPKYAVLDSAVTHTLPHSIAAATGMDALTHAVEAYIGRSTSKETRADAEEAVRLIFDNIEDACDHKSDIAEKNMMKASHLAGRAFTRSYVGYVHAVSHSLSGQYNMPHGLTNAILLPLVLEKYGSAAYKKLARLAKCASIGSDSDSDEVRAKKFITAIKKLNKKLGIPEKIEGIKDGDIDKLSKYADHEANPLYPVPVLWDAEELKAIYHDIQA